MLSNLPLAAALFGVTTLAAVSSTVSKVASSPAPASSTTKKVASSSAPAPVSSTTSKVATTSSSTSSTPSPVTMPSNTLSFIENEQCYTQYSTVQPVSVGTTEFDTFLTQTATQFLYVTPSASVTPAAITSTVTTTSTNTGTITASTTTDTYTTSTTITLTSTEIDTSSYVQVVTTTLFSTIASTTTVAPPVGFTGLANWPGYQAKRDVMARREALLPRAQNASFHVPVIPAAGAAHIRKAVDTGVQYAYNVECTKTVTYLATATSTVTEPTSTTTLPVPTSFSTQVLSATKTITITPADVTQIKTVTQMASTTSTSVTTTTSTQTQTSTVFEPSATYLAQCAPNNLVNSAVGQKIGTITYNGDFTLQSFYPTDQTGYGCCAACALASDCAGFAQAPSSAGGAAGGACYYLTTDGRCNAQQSFGDEFHYYNTNGNGYIVGNGQCGFLGPAAGVPQTS